MTAPLPEHTTTEARRTISLRLVLSVAAMLLVTATAIGIGTVAQRNLRTTLQNEIHGRLLLEASSLANVASDALLNDFPELLLMPVVQQTVSDRPELAFVTIVDHQGVIQGDVDSRLLNEAFSLPEGLALGSVVSTNGTVLLEGPELIVASSQIHRGDELLGNVHVALKRSYLDQAIARSRRQLMLVSGVLLLIAALVAGALMHQMLRPVTALREGLMRIGQGDLETPMQLRDRTELGLLADTVNDMATRIRESQQSLIEKERLDFEMELARHIQSSLMPDTGFRQGRYSSQGLFESSAEAGGDYFDIFELPDDKLGLFVADVAGKGLGGCIVSSMLAALVKSQRNEKTSPREMLVHLDQVLSGFLEPGIFVTAFYGILNQKTSQFTFASAAHCPLILARPSIGEVEEHRTKGVPLGILPHNVVAQSLVDHTVLLSGGDMILVYTDGLTEAPNRTNAEQFGEQRVVEIMRQESCKGVDHLLAALRTAVTEWEGSHDHSDDLTMLALKCDRADETEVSMIDCSTKSEVNNTMANIYSQENFDDIVAGASHLHVGDEPVEVETIEAWLNEHLNTADPLIVQALYEYVANIQEHGFLPPRRSSADLWCWPQQSDHKLAGRILIRDKGRVCPPNSIESPDLTNAQTRSRGRGLGWEIIRRVMDDVHYSTVPTVGNMCLLLPGARKNNKETLCLKV